MKKYIVHVVVLLSVCTLDGQQYNTILNFKDECSSLMENLKVGDAIYTIGVGICPTNECGYFAKYDLNGKVEWMREYPQIDINSRQVMLYRDHHFYITGKAQDSVATKTLVLDTLGNVLNEWNYSVEGATTNFSKEVIYDEDYYYFVLTEVVDGDTRGALYKCDYTGNLVERIVLPILIFTTPVSLRNYQENLLISINHRFEESCPFGLNGISPGATYLAEVDKETMTILRDKKDVCYRFVSNDMYTSPTSEILRTVILRDSMPIGTDGNFGFIRYDDDWEVEDVKEYPHDFTKAITNLKYTNDGQYYYTIQTENVPQTDGSIWPFSDLLIQKWTAGHELLWEKRYTSHKKMKRLNGLNFTFDEDGNLHIVGFIDPDFPNTEKKDFWLFSVDADGCFNGDCSDVIDLDDLVNLEEGVSIVDEAVAYPNPVRDVLFLKNIPSQTHVKVMDVMGQVIYETPYNSPQGLNLEYLASGVYFIKLGNNRTLRILKH